MLKKRLEKDMLPKMEVRVAILIPDKGFRARKSTEGGVNMHPIHHKKKKILNLYTFAEFCEIQRPEESTW